MTGKPIQEPIDECEYRFDRVPEGELGRIGLSIAASKPEKVAIQATQMERRTRRHSLTKGT